MVWADDRCDGFRTRNVSSCTNFKFFTGTSREMGLGRRLGSRARLMDLVTRHSQFRPSLAGLVAPPWVLGIGRPSGHSFRFDFPFSEGP